MARASTPTLLPLDRFARIVGINPVHFNGAAGSSLWPQQGACSDVWPQHPWQYYDVVSREELAEAIAGAEAEIANYLGYDVAPRWHYREQHNVTSNKFTGRSFSIKTNRSRVIASGQRAATLVAANAAIVLSDPDSDQYNDRATITVPTTVTDPRELRLFYSGTQADPTYEIRPLQTVTIAAGVATITVNSWQLIKAERQEFYNHAEFQALDIEDANNFVSGVDVYRIYNDNSLASSVSYWRDPCDYCGGNGCPECSIGFDGTFAVADPKNGIIHPYPASYGDNGWFRTTTCYGSRPHRVEVSYYAGLETDEYRQGVSVEPLSQYWAETITWLAAARLNRPICDCSNVKAMVGQLQEDFAAIKQNSMRYITPGSDVYNPFGTRFGEVKAWRRVVQAMEVQLGAI